MNKFFAANLSFTLLCLAALLASCEKGSTGSGSGSGSETPPEGGSAQLVLSDPSDKTLSGTYVQHHVQDQSGLDCLVIGRLVV